MRQSSCLFICLLAAACFLAPACLHAQRLLDKKISFECRQQPLERALKDLSRSGGFYFSYNSNNIPADSLVSLSVQQEPVRNVLNMLLGGSYEYRETGNYIIIRPGSGAEAGFTVSGTVVSKASGEKISQASIYESRQLVATLSDAQGTFMLHLRDHSLPPLITISKAGYNDTSFVTSSRQPLVITLSPIRSVVLKPVTVTPYSRLERNWLGKFFISSRQKMQDINLSRFFASRSFQYSIVPGVGTHGRLSAQVVNKFSMNVLGGYSAGVNGLELGGLFNMDKKDVHYVQLAGLFNIVGGSMKGLQIGGLHNSVMDSVSGIEVAGLSNVVKGPLEGIQIAGLSNRISGNVTGVMLAGITNATPGEVAGMQLAGITNSSGATVYGVQIAGIFNHAGNLKGWQFALVNKADSSSGYSIGLVNIIPRGYHVLSVSYNEMLDVNIALKTGNKKLYSILLAGADIGREREAYSWGYGLGTEIPFSRSVSLATDLTAQSIFTGSWKSLPLLVRLQPAFQISLSRKLALFAGPAFSVCFYDKDADVSLMPAKYRFSMGRHINGWPGWQAGIRFF